MFDGAGVLVANIVGFRFQQDKQGVLSQGEMGKKIVNKVPNNPYDLKATFSRAIRSTKKLSSNIKYQGNSFMQFCDEYWEKHGGPKVYNTQIFAAFADVVLLGDSEDPNRMNLYRAAILQVQDSDGELLDEKGNCWARSRAAKAICDAYMNQKAEMRVVRKSVKFMVRHKDYSKGDTRLIVCPEAIEILHQQQAKRWKKTGDPRAPMFPAETHNLSRLIKVLKVFVAAKRASTDPAVAAKYFPKLVFDGGHCFRHGGCVWLRVDMGITSAEQINRIVACSEDNFKKYSRSNEDRLKLVEEKEADDPPFSLYTPSGEFGLGVAVAPEVG